RAGHSVRGFLLGVLVEVTDSQNAGLERLGKLGQPGKYRADISHVVGVSLSKIGGYRVDDNQRDVADRANGGSEAIEVPVKVECRRPRFRAYRVQDEHLVQVRIRGMQPRNHSISGVVLGGDDDDVSGDRCVRASWPCLPTGNRGGKGESQLRFTDTGVS